MERSLRELVLRVRNPFTPTFGSTPPLLAGREGLVEEFGRSLDYGPGAPGRVTLYTGARGTGKTVMLNEAVEQARRRGWVVINETARAGLVDRLVTMRLPELLEQFGGSGVARGRRLSGITTPVGVGVSWQTDTPAQRPRDLYRLVFDLTDALAPHETGLMITVDEIHRGISEDLRELSHVLQLGIREDRDVAFAAAGLPAAVSDLLHDEVLTFLRRAERHTLGPVPPAEVSEALRQPIEDHGREISSDALATAVEATRGYPFLIQLTGYHIWEQNPHSAVISVADAAAGIREASRRLGRLVHEPALQDVSAAGRDVLYAMAADPGPTRVSDLAGRLGKTRTWVNTYRARLIDAGLIQPAGHGLVTFTAPYMREYLRDRAHIHEATEWDEPPPEHGNPAGN